MLLAVTSTSGIVQLLHDLAQETSSEDPWAPSLESMGELIGQYQSFLEELAHTLDPARKSKVDALKWPFGEKGRRRDLEESGALQNCFVDRFTNHSSRGIAFDKARPRRHDVGSSSNQGSG